MCLQYKPDLHAATVPPRDLRNFILTLGEQWAEIAKYLGFSGEEITAITDNYPDSIAKQVSTLLSIYIHVHTSPSLSVCIIHIWVCMYTCIYILYVHMYHILWILERDRWTCSWRSGRCRTLVRRHFLSCTS